jgi:hypothetical protein
MRLDETPGKPYPSRAKRAEHILEELMPMRTRSALAIPEITMKSVDIRACVNRFLLSKVGSQFAAGEPDFDAEEERWQVPILMITPGYRRTGRRSHRITSNA